MQRFLWALVVGSIAMAGGSSAQANLLQNGSFEQPIVVNSNGYQTISQPANIGAPGGWQVTAGSVDLYGSPWTAQSGNQSLDLNGTTSGTIEQAVTLTSIGKYALTFYYAGNPTAANKIKDFDLLINGVIVASYQFINSGSTTAANMGWLEGSYTLNVLSIASPTTIAFVSKTAGNGGAALDNISLLAVDPSAVPEPTSLALAGLGALGLVVARRKKAVA